MEYKAFRIGALFEKLNAPYIGSGRKQDNVSKERTEEFSLPLINCKWGDNGIMYYGRPSDFVHYENVLSVVYNGPPILVPERKLVLQRKRVVRNIVYR